MTKAKKVLSLVLAVVMVAAMFAFSASAATENATFTVSVDKTPVTVGEEITVTVNLETDYYTASTNVPVYYNPAVFEFVAGSVVTEPIFGAGTTGVMSYNDATTGCLKVGFYPDTTSGDATAQMMNGTLFTFKLRAIANGTSDIALHAEDQKSATNVGGTLYCGSYASSEPDNNPATVGQAFTIKNTTATVGSTVEVKLVGKTGTVADETSTGIVDEAKHYIYGIVPGGNIEDFFEMSDGSALNIAIGSAKALNGTGATVTVGDTVYTLIVFGDVDCDGALSSADSGMIKQYVGGDHAKIENDAALFAADVDNDTALSSADSGMIKQYAGGDHSKVPQTR